MAPPEILKVAREFLGLSQEAVEAHVQVSRSTLQRIERGVRDLRHYALLIQHFYEQNGIEFVPPKDGRGWGIFNHNTNDVPLRLNRLELRSGRRRKVEVSKSASEKDENDSRSNE